MKQLKWGETPWDTLSKEELLREVQRMFSALQSADSVLRTSKANNARSSFWGREGSGGRALERCSQVIEPVYEAYDAESVYRSFFRYANSLLFDVLDEEKWIICPICGGMWGGRRTAQYVGTVCSAYPIVQNSECKGIFRWLEWRDLAKKSGESKGEPGASPLVDALIDHIRGKSFRVGVVLRISKRAGDDISEINLAISHAELVHAYKEALFAMADDHMRRIDQAIETKKRKESEEGR